MKRRTCWLSLRAKASGNAQINQAQTQIIHQHIHGDDVRAGAVVELLPAVDQAAVGVFVGRNAHVEQLLGLINPSETGLATAVVSAVAGLAGVGKTTLARHVAQVAVGRGWFPGGAVFIDLRGYDADLKDRIAPGQVFRPLLRALGVLAEQIPPVVDEQAAVYRQMLAHLAGQGRSVLVVLDNTSNTEQIAGLLPDHRAHRALVTSRHTLGDLDGIRVVELDVLDQAEAVDLIDQALRERNPADQRATADSGYTAELARVCGFLPLALRIAAALLADDPGMTVTSLVDELADTATRLDTLTYGGRAVAAAFDLSWHHLEQRDPGAARLFRFLPLNPGPDISTQAAAALTDLPPARVRPLLRVLRRAHLLEPGTAPDRWSMHDLVGAYATGLPEGRTGERAAATSRLLAHYTTTADAANDHLTALPGQPVSGRFAGRDQALAWLDTERANLVAAVDLAAATGEHHTTLRLATALTEYLSWRQHLDDSVTVATTALHATLHLNNLQSEGTAWGNLGLALRQVRRFDEAIAALRQSLNISRETGNRHSEANAWNNLGNALREVRRFDEAIAAHQHAIDIYRETGDRHGEGGARNNLGLVLRQVRRFDEAIAAHQHAGDIYRETGDRHSEGMSWNNLGAVLRQVGQFDEAFTALKQALNISRETGDRHGEGMVWANLGLALAEVRRLDEAITALEQAVAAYTQTGAIEAANEVRYDIEVIKGIQSEE
ncbi:MAG TPA: tetratricopeptide repeat protein [Mycobacteriales bacterium]